jgi:predicted hydrolase (HD superfamily)
LNSFMTESTVKKVNFDYILNEIKPITEYGLKAKLGAKPFLRGQEADLKTEFDKIRAFIELRQRRDIIDLLKHIKNILETIHRARSNQVLDEVELFEIKNFLISVDKMDKILRGISNTGIKLLQLTPLPQLYKKLDPACEKLNTFYIYDEYSQKLKEIRSEKRQIEKTISLLKKKIREEVEGRHNIRLNLKDEAEFWGIVGLLHDIDFEMYPDEHCVKMQEILAQKGVDERIIRAAASHGYGLTDVTIKPEHTMEKILFATDELTGLIGAAVLMRPSKSSLDMELKSLKKKFKSTGFAAGCSRETIKAGAEMLGWELDYLLDETLKAMQEYEKSKL